MQHSVGTRDYAQARDTHTIIIVIVDRIATINYYGRLMPISDLIPSLAESIATCHCSI